MLLCVAAAAVPLRVATFNIELGLDAQGTVSHDDAADVLARIDADVVTLQEVRSQDVGTTIDALAATLGYTHQYVAVPGSGEPSPLDTNNPNVFPSRYPITAVDGISSPSGAKDMTRVIPAVVVDVPGTTAQRTHDLLNWANLSDLPGDGDPAALDLPGDPAEAVNIFRVSVSIP